MSAGGQRCAQANANASSPDVSLSVSAPHASPAALKPFHPIVRAWFRDTLGAPSAPQRKGWPAIASGANTLILAPTGTGKTLTAFLWELNQLIVDGLR